MSRRIDGDTEDMALYLVELNREELGELRKRLELITEFKGKTESEISVIKDKITLLTEKIKKVEESKQDKLEILIIAREHIWKAIGGLLVAWATIQWENIKAFLDNLVK